MSRDRNSRFRIDEEKERYIAKEGEEKVRARDRETGRRKERRAGVGLEERWGRVGRTKRGLAQDDGGGSPVRFHVPADVPAADLRFPRA